MNEENTTVNGGEVELEGGQKVETGELFKWSEVGSKLSGQLRDYREQDTPKGKGHVYELRTKEGTIPFFAPSDLHRKLKEVKLGELVKIEFKETTKTRGGNDFKVFDVSHYPASDNNLKALGLDALEGGEAVNDDPLA